MILDRSLLYFLPLDQKTVYVPFDACDPEKIIPFKGDAMPVDLVDGNEVLYEHLLNAEDFYSNVESLIFSLFLYEPSFHCQAPYVNEVVNRSIEFCKSSSIFPNLKNIYVLHDTISVGGILADDDIDIKTIRTPYFLLNSLLSEEWYNQVPNTNQTNKCIFMIGDPNKIGRFPVLYEFYKNNDLNIIDYSLNFNFHGSLAKNQTVLNHIESVWLSTSNSDDDMCVWVKSIMDESSMSTADFANICSQLQKRFLDDDFFDKPAGEIFPQAAYNFPKQYKGANVVLYSETIFRDCRVPNFLPNNIDGFTEKAWKPLLTKKPFVSCSGNDWVYTRLECMGFKTFLEYTDFPSKTESKKVTELAHKRTVSLLKNLEKNKEHILLDVDHNYRLWKSMATQAWKNLYDCCPPLKNISKETLITLFTLGGKSAYYESHYKQDAPN